MTLPKTFCSIGGDGTEDDTSIPCGMPGVVDEYATYGFLLYQSLFMNRYLNVAFATEETLCLSSRRLTVLGAAWVHHQFYKLSDERALDCVLLFKEECKSFFVSHLSSYTLVLVHCLWRYMQAADPNAYQKYLHGDFHIPIHRLLVQKPFRSESSSSLLDNEDRQLQPPPQPQSPSNTQPDAKQQRTTRLQHAHQKPSRDGGVQQQSQDLLSYDLDTSDASDGDASDGSASDGDASDGSNKRVMEAEEQDHCQRRRSREYTPGRSRIRTSRESFAALGPDFNDNQKDPNDDGKDFRKKSNSSTRSPIRNPGRLSCDDAADRDSLEPWDSDVLSDSHLEKGAQSFGYLLEHIVMPICSCLSVQAQSAWLRYQTLFGATAQEMPNTRSTVSPFSLQQQAHQATDTSNRLKLAMRSDGGAQEDSDGFRSSERWIDAQQEESMRSSSEDSQCCRQTRDLFNPLGEGQTPDQSVDGTAVSVLGDPYSIPDAEEDRHWEIHPIELVDDVEPWSLLEILRLIVVVRLLHRLMDIVGPLPMSYQLERRSRGRPWIPSYLAQRLPTMLHLACLALRLDFPLQDTERVIGNGVKTECPVRHVDGAVTAVRPVKCVSARASNEGSSDSKTSKEKEPSLSGRRSGRLQHAVTSVQEQSTGVEESQVKQIDAVFNNDELGILCKQLMPSRGLKDKWAYVLKIINQIIKSEFGQEAYPYGSFMNGFQTVDSDLDLMIPLTEQQRLFGNQEYQRTSYKMAVRAAACFVNAFSVVLTQFRDLSIRAVPQASVPVLKILQGLPPFDDIACDLTFDNWLGVKNTNLLRAYAESDQRAHFLGILIKHWARQRRLNKTFEGTLSSYAWTLMVIYFLQMRSPPLLPNLQAVRPSSSEVASSVTKHDKHDCYFYDPPPVSLRNHDDGYVLRQSLLPHGPVADGVTLEMLLFEFFQFYAVQFNWYANVVSMRLAPETVFKKTVFQRAPTPPTAPKKRKKRKKKTAAVSSTTDTPPVPENPAPSVVVLASQHQPQTDKLTMEATKKEQNERVVDDPVLNDRKFDRTDSSDNDEGVFSNPRFFKTETTPKIEQLMTPDYVFHDYTNLLNSERQMEAYPWLAIEDPFENGRILRPTRSGMTRIFVELNRAFNLLSRRASFTDVVSQRIDLLPQRID